MNISLEVFTLDVVAYAIKNLSTGKAIVSNDIPVFNMKETTDLLKSLLKTGFQMQ